MSMESPFLAPPMFHQSRCSCLTTEAKPSEFLNLINSSLVMREGDRRVFVADMRIHFSVSDVQSDTALIRRERALRFLGGPHLFEVRIAEIGIVQRRCGYLRAAAQRSGRSGRFGNPRGWLVFRSFVNVSGVVCQPWRRHCQLRF